MKELKEAIKAEKEYLKAREKGIDYSFPAKLKELGFESVEDYVFDKKVEEVRELDIPIERCPHSEAVGRLLEAIKAKQYCIVVSESPEGTTIVYGGDGDESEAASEANGLPYHYLYHNGGTVICNSGDLGFGIVLPKWVDGWWILRMVYEILKPYSGGFSIQGNDIVLDGKKVVGYGRTRSSSDVSAFTVFVSFEDSANVIREVCRKIGKTPGYIGSEVLTKEQFEEDLVVWLHKQ